MWWRIWSNEIKKLPLLGKAKITHSFWPRQRWFLGILNLIEFDLERIAKRKDAMFYCRDLRDKEKGEKSGGGYWLCLAAKSVTTSIALSDSYRWSMSIISPVNLSQLIIHNCLFPTLHLHVQNFSTIIRTKNTLCHAIFIIIRIFSRALKYNLFSLKINENKINK